MKQHIIKSILILLCSAAVLSGQDTQQLPEIEIKGTTLKVLPAERVRALGLTDYPDIPVEENAAYDFIKAMNALKTPSDEYMPELKDKWYALFDTSGTKEQPDIRDFEPLLLDNRKAAELAQHALSKESAAYPVDAEAERMMVGVQLPHLSGIRALGRFFAVQALYRLHYNETDAAIQSLELAYRSAASVGDIFFIGALVHIGTERNIFPAAEQVINSGKLNIRQYKKLVRILDRVQKQFPDARKAMESEKLFATLTIEQIFSGKVNPRVIGFPGISIPSKDRDIQKTEAALNRILLPDRIILKDIKSTYSRIIELSSLPWPEYRKRYLEIDWDPKSGEIGNLFTSMFIPALRNARREMVKGEAQINLLRAGCRLKLLQTETGSFPQTIDNVTDSAGTPIIDPFTCAPFRYTAAENSIQLSSAGIDENRKWAGHLTLTLTSEKKAE